MAKCVVCSKSAGPFYSLHKACHLVYRDTQTCLQDNLSPSVLQSGNNSKVVEAIQSCKPTSAFSAAQFKKLFVQEWSKQANQCVKKSNLQIEVAKNLLRLAEEYSLSDEDLEPFLLMRLENVPHLDGLQKNKTIEKKFKAIPENIELADNEFVIWRFENIARSEPITTSQEKKWTVLRSVMNSMTLRSRYKQLPSRTENAGALIVTNQTLHYINNNKLTQTKYSDIHSLTPMKNGVRVQATTSGATPDTYITGDGRFTFALLQYAQGLDG